MDRSLSDSALALELASGTAELTPLLTGCDLLKISNIKPLMLLVISAPNAFRSLKVTLFSASTCSLVAVAEAGGALGGRGGG